MKFVFSQIDSNCPNRQFYFLMFVDNNNIYQLVETCPPLNPNDCSKLLEDLNEDNEIGIFVFRLRQLFCQFAAMKK